MKKIILDLEFITQNFVDAKITEFCVLFVEDNKVVEELYEKILLDESYNELSKKYKRTLDFNHIYSQEDVDKHNKNAKNIIDFLKLFTQKVKSFSDEKLPLTGWTCAGSDVPILKKHFELINEKYEDVFDYHTRDISSQFQPFQKYIFLDGKRKNLGSAHKELIGTYTEEEFHNAKVDCLALLDLDIYLEKKVSQLFNL